MKFPRSTVLHMLCMLPLGAQGFTPAISNAQHSSTLLYSSRAEDAARAAAAAGAAAGAAALKPAPHPKLYEDDLLDDMQQCLLKLERRVKQGPGALSMLEVEEFDRATIRILDEMKLNEHNRPKPAPAFPDVQVEEEVGSTTTSAATAAAAPPPPPQQQQQQQEPPSRNEQADYVAAATAVSSSPQKVVTDTSNDEGPAYDGTGGLGLAKGTVNTYVIPGMDEMSPQEYQKALQKTISDRQAQRVAQQRTYGNLQSNDYLNNLSGGGGGPSQTTTPQTDVPPTPSGPPSEEDHGTTLTAKKRWAEDSGNKKVVWDPSKSIIQSDEVQLGGHSDDSS